MTDTEIDLGPTPTYAERTADLDADGLVIRLTPRRTGNTVTHRYAVEEIPPDRIGCRAFLLTDLSGAEQRTVVTGGMPYCSCPAGQKGHRRGGCKHKDSMTALVREGRL